jgi:hypothetical protein
VKFDDRGGTEPPVEAKNKRGNPPSIERRPHAMRGRRKRKARRKAGLFWDCLYSRWKRFA